MARHKPRRPAPPTPDRTSIRIIGGAWRGRRVEVTRGEGLRPTPDRVRETLFNWLAPRIQGARCLDLFAGSGALGFEALSRGAAHVTFVERDPAAVASIRATLEQLDATDRARVQLGDALTHRPDERVDIVFVDPPFSVDLQAAAIEAIYPTLTPDARIYIEYPAEQADSITGQLGDRLTRLRVKRAGGVGFCLARPTVDGEDRIT